MNSSGKDVYRIEGPDMRSPLLAHIPHSSNKIPTDLQPDFILGSDHMKEEQRALVDWFTDELFDFIPELGGTSLVYQVSRFVCDPERFEDDEQEVMSKRGMGVLYTHGVNSERIRQDLSSTQREHLLDRFYRPHHQAFTKLVDESIEKFGKCFIFDCHSYPQHALPYELFGDGKRPEICIGADPEHSTKALTSLVKESGEAVGYEVCLNSPFKGSIVPMKYFGDSRVQSLMFEIRRDTYMNEQLTSRTQAFTKLKTWLREVAEEIKAVL